MFEALDSVMLARLQFAFVVSFHILFPAFTIGLSSWLAVVEWKWLKTGNEIYREIYKMWVKIFAVCFGMGVVSGVVMSYQFGTNWSVFSDKIGNVIGPLLGYEVLTAFFLEASFLGVMLFGWDRVSKRMHFVSTCIVAVGTLTSAFWILSANSWMQTPQGFEVGEGGILFPTSWTQIIFNPSFPYRFAHMVTAAYLTTAFVVGGIGAYYLWRQLHVNHAKIMVKMALMLSIVLAPAQLFIGHLHGDNTMEHQPIKVAAMEGNWERGSNKPLYLFGIPNEKTQTTDYGITIPNMASWILTGSTDGVIPGLKEVPAAERPPVLPVFWSFRIMVGLGLAMIFVSFLGGFLYYRKTLYESRLYQLLAMALTPAGFIALLAGWFVTEIGRQPYSVYGVLHTGDSVSPVIAEQVAITLFAFVVVYSFVFGAGTYYILKLIGKGPKIGEDKEEYYDHSRMAAASEAIAKRDAS